MYKYYSSRKVTKDLICLIKIWIFSWLKFQYDSNEIHYVLIKFENNQQFEGI